MFYARDRVDFSALKGEVQRNAFIELLNRWLVARGGLASDFWTSGESVLLDHSGTIHLVSSDDVFLSKISLAYLSNAPGTQ